MASAISFQGITSGLQTDQLVNAIIGQEGQTVQRMRDRQTLNTQRSAALKAMATSMKALATSFAALSDKFNARTVSSTDTNGIYVTASATGAAVGSYDVKVTQVATKGQLSPTQGVTLSVADPTAAIFDGTDGKKASFAVQGTDGVIKAFQLTNNSLNGLRDAINASGAGVTATIVNSGSSVGVASSLAMAASLTTPPVVPVPVSLAVITN